MEHFEKRLAAEIREGRRRKGLSQESLAERAGVATETISHFERAVTQPSLKTLVTLMQHVDLDVAAVFDVEAPEEPMSKERSKLEAELRRLIAGFSDREFTMLVEIARAIEKGRG